MDNDELKNSVISSAHEIKGKHRWDSLVERAEEYSIVIIGGSTHGTQEFYKAKSEITRKLIEEKNFAAVLIDSNWADAYRVNRYVRHFRRDRNASSALEDYAKFPHWLWRNEPTSDFIEWLRSYNARLPEDNRIGFYGLDLYSMYSSIDTLLSFFDRIEPAASEKIKTRFAHFEEYCGEDLEHGIHKPIDINEDMIYDAVTQMLDNHRADFRRVYEGGFASDEEIFFIEENARIAANADEYYKAMLSNKDFFWNLREKHMADTIDNMAFHISDRKAPKIVIWTHNLHAGNASATGMAERGELSLGQIMKETNGSDVYLIGLTTSQGNFLAAPEWGGKPETFEYAAGENNGESVFKNTRIPDFFLDFNNIPENLTDSLCENRPVMTIGMVHHPEPLKESNCIVSKIACQFDSVVHFDYTTAVVPLDIVPESEKREIISKS